MTNYSDDAFLSHNSADKPSVEIIAAALEKQGLKCFLDKWDILPSDQWMRNLENAMEIRAQLQLIKRRIRDEHIQVPAHLAWLLESAPEPDDKG